MQLVNFEFFFFYQVTRHKVSIVSICTPSFFFFFSFFLFFFFFFFGLFDGDRAIHGMTTSVVRMDHGRDSGRGGCVARRANHG